MVRQHICEASPGYAVMSASVIRDSHPAVPLSPAAGNIGKRHLYQPTLQRRPQVVSPEVGPMGEAEGAHEL